MTLHALKEFIKYQLIAKSRHGIHSPFVYDLIDKVLLNKNRKPGDTCNKIVPSQLPLKYKRLLTPIIAYYIEDNIHFPEQPVFMFFNAALDALPVAVLANHTHILFLTDIHINAKAEGNWNMMRTNSEVRLSIDLYNVGLLFFRKEFKEKQHFTLRY